MNQLAIVGGMLIVYFVNYFIAQYGAARAPWNVEYGWRWMFGSGVVPALVFFFLLLLVPESPRWLTKKRRRDEALAILTRVDGARVCPGRTPQHRGGHRPGKRPADGTLGTLDAAAAGAGRGAGRAAAGDRRECLPLFRPEDLREPGAGEDTAMLQTILVGAVMLPSPSWPSASSTGWAANR